MSEFRRSDDVPLMTIGQSPERGTAPLEAYRDLSPVLLWSADAEGRLTWVNRPWLLYTGDALEAVLTVGFKHYIHPQDLPEVEAVLDKSFVARTPIKIELRLRGGDNGYRAFLLEGDPVVERDGSLRWLGSASDIDAIRSSHVRQRALVSELQHRVKNILAVIRSISARSVETSTSLEQFAAHYPGRLDALSRTQGVLARRSADGVELEALIRDELSAAAPHDDDQVLISGPAILLKDRAIEVFALAIHELATNAVKYGALARPEGRINIAWRLYPAEGGARLNLAWQERGVQAINPSPARIGFGRDLIERGLPYDLGADTRLDFVPGGLRCTMDMALSTRIVPLDDLKGLGMDVAAIR